MSLQDESWFSEDKRWNALMSEGYNFDVVDLLGHVSLAMSLPEGGGVVVVVDGRMCREGLHKIMIETCEAYAKQHRLFSTDGIVN